MAIESVSQTSAVNDASTQAGYVSPSKTELEDLADKLHDVGEKGGKKDDYDRRLQALASEFLPTLSAEDRGRFLGVVLEKDKGATGSWLQNDRLDKLVDGGRLSGDNRQAVLDAVQRGYDDGNVEKEKAAGFIDTDRPSQAPAEEGGGDGGADPVEAPKDVLEGGFKEVGSGDEVVYDDIRNVSYPGEYGDGWLRFETRDGGKLAVNEKNAPGVYGLAERAYLDEGRQTIDDARAAAGLPAASETDALSLETSEEIDGHRLKVGDAAMKLMVDDIKGRKDLYEDSPQAEFVRLIEARSAVTNGKFIHPVYENRHIGVGGRTKTETENLLKLEQADMKEMLDEGAINRELDAVMKNPEISALYQKSLESAVAKVPEADRKTMADKLASVVESSDYVAQGAKLPANDAPRFRADVEDSMAQLSLLDPERAKGAGQKFALNALASDIDSKFAEPDAIPDEAKVDAVDAGLGAIKDGMDKAKLPFEVADAIDELLENGGDAAKADFADVAARLRSEGYAPEDIDKAFSGVEFASGKQESIRGLVDDLSSNGLLPAVSGAIGITSTVRSLVNDGFGETPEEKLATAGGIIGMVASLPDSTKLLGNIAKGVDGSALDLLGVDKASKDRLGVETRHGNQAVSAVGGTVADTDIPDAEVENRGAVLDGLKGAVGDTQGVDAARLAKSTLNVLSDYSGKAGGMLGLITGGMDAAAAFSGDASPAEKASAVLGVMSGTLDVAPTALNAGTKFVSAVAGQGAGAVAERVVGAITRGLGPVGVLFTVASELVSVFVGDAKDKKEAKEQYQWFSKLAGQGVMKDDWNLKYDYAVTTLNSFGNARSHIKNLSGLRDADWGGRQAPKERSIFDFHREEFADFKTKWEKDRGAATYVEFLDPDKRKADFKREKDQMDEVEAYLDSHPTYFPGYNDWVLEL